MVGNIVDERILAIESLRALRKYLKYRELENYLNLPGPVLWRYITGKVEPTVDRAKEILEAIISKGIVRDIVSRQINILNKHIVNTYKVVYDVSILKLIALEAYYHFKKYQPTAITTVEVDGIPVALSVANLFNTKVIVAKKVKELGFKDYIEHTYMQGDPPSLVTLYIPSELIKPQDNVLIVDDLLRSGRTIKTLIEMLTKAKAKVIGVFAVIAVGTQWRKILENLVDEIYVIHQII